MLFNISKSAYAEFDKYKNINIVKLSNMLIPKVDKILNLGLPIGEKEAKYKFLENIFRKLEKSFYSLYGLGCKPNSLFPHTIAFVYKQY